METTNFLTAAELAEHLRIRPKTVLAWTAAGRIPGVRLGARTIRFNLEDVRRALDRAAPGKGDSATARAPESRDAREPDA